jgi:hypothetical protein
MKATLSALSGLIPWMFGRAALIESYETRK